jgi:hypothetical protein
MVALTNQRISSPLFQISDISVKFDGIQNKMEHCRQIIWKYKGK